jgi:hypothetical protein
MCPKNCKERVVKRLENKPRWSYGGFMRFRERVAKAVGINLWEMEGYSEMEKPLGASTKGKEWPGTNPIEDLLNHSDCEGDLDWESCGKIAPILEGIIGAWNDPNNHDTTMGLILVAAMRECAEEEADLVFT